MNTKKESCPFCGAEGDSLKVIDWFEEEDNPFVVQCQECLAHGPMASDAETAIMLWNLRDEKMA